MQQYGLCHQRLAGKNNAAHYITSCIFFTQAQILGKPPQTSWYKFQTTSIQHLDANFRQTSTNTLVQISHNPPQTSWCKFQTSANSLVQISDKPPQRSCCKFHTNLHKDLAANFTQTSTNILVHLTSVNRGTQ